MNTSTQTKPCDNATCRREFLPVRPHQRFCSDECRLDHHRQDTNPLEHEAEFSLTLANPNPSFKTRKDGDHYFVEFELQREEWDHFTDPNVNRQGLVIEAQCMVTHSNQRQEKKEELKGGPLSELAGIFCKDPNFTRWLNEQGRDSHLESLFVNADGQIFNPVMARADILETCKIQSRKELDHNPAAARIFHEQIRLPYSNWLDKQRRPE